MSDRGILRAGALMTTSAGLVGAASYAGTLLMAHLLPVGQFIDYSAAQALLTTVGVVASALVPLPLARAVRAFAPGSAGRRDSAGFALVVALLGGVVAATALTAIGLFLDTPGVAVAMGLAAFAVFAISPTWGWLQGESRFARYAVASVAEVLLRLVVAVGAVGLGFGAAGAVGGFAAGTLVVVWVGVTALRHDLGLRPGLLRDRDRWRETGVIAAAQCALSALVGVDLVFVALVDGRSPAGAAYQAVATMAKGPVYVAASAALVSFPLLRNASADRAPALVGAVVRSFARLALPVATVVATLPAHLVLGVLPDSYAGAIPLLPWLAVAGLGFGAIGVPTMVLLGVGAHRRCGLGLLGCAVVVPTALVTGWSAAGVPGLACGAAVGTVLAALLPTALAWRHVPRSVRRAALRVPALVGPLVGALLLTRSSPVLWGCVVVVTVLVVLRPNRRPGRTPGETLDLLHLGFEDPAMPGAGGGALRTHEIDKRLVAAGHRVTVLVTRFPGCRDRVEDGVRYRHVGIGSGRTLVGRVAGYAAVLPFAARRHPADLVVEDFFAPISTMAAPLWTGRRTVGVVQWLNARDKARQYHLPFHLVERFGVRRHRRVVAVSRGVAGQLTALHPGLDVEVIGNGVDPLAFEATPGSGDDVVFVGRLESAQKGLDLLLHAWALACPRITGTLVIAGTGPDERELRALAAELGVADRVRFAGWVSGRAKFALLAGARVAVVPSRFETFGIVAVEALATGTPVLAFDIPCLREVVPAHSGERVPPFDVARYAEALVRLHRVPKTADRVRQARRFAGEHDWDVLARRQADFYLRCVHGDPVRDPAAVVRAQLTDLGRAPGTRPRLLVFGNVGNGNTGDESLLAATLAALDPDAEVTVLSRDPGRVTALHGVPACPMTPRHALRAVRGATGLVVVGGGMFGPGLPPLVQALPHLVAAARHTGRAVAYVGIGVYDGMPAHVLGRLRRAAARGTMTVRDRLSLRTLDLPVDVPCVGDLAWLVPTASPDLARQALRRAGADPTRPLLLLAPKAADEARTLRSVEAFATAARWWTARGGAVVALALSDRADHGRPPEHTDAALAEAVATAAGVPVPVVGPNLPPGLAKAVVARADAVLGLRFHALVFALAAGTPCAGFPWEPKTRALAEEHRLPTPTDDRGLTRWLDSVTTPTLLPTRR
ncbi:glycosyltransferase [Actinosynnema sp. NPDC020468]|uniref:glycosyltransferase n=1 Tax=Actinosynnema sp. NPDC020468 TaxID=3154488 RepID=UPI0033C29466